VRFDFEDQTGFSKASIASLVVDGLIAQNNVVLRGWLQRQGAIVVGSTTLAAAFGATKPTKWIIERLLRRFPTEVKQLADNLGFDARNFTNREVRYLEDIKTLDKFQLLVEASAKIRDLTRSLSLENGAQQSWEQERWTRSFSMCTPITTRSKFAHAFFNEEPGQKGRVVDGDKGTCRKIWPAWDPSYHPSGT
jgi:hypothetical protein